MCLFAAGIFNQFQNLRNCRIIKLFRCAHLKKSASIYTTADNLRTFCYFSRNRLSGQCKSIYKGCSRYNHTIERNSLSCFDDDLRTNLYIIRINLFELSVFFNIRIFRTDIHHCTD